MCIVTHESLLAAAKHRFAPHQHTRFRSRLALQLGIPLSSPSAVRKITGSVQTLSVFGLCVPDSSRDSPDSSKRFAPRIGCQSEGTRNPTGQQQQHKKPSLLTFESKQKARFPPLSSGPQASQKKWSGKAAKAKRVLSSDFLCVQGSAIFIFGRPTLRLNLIAPKTSPLPQPLTTSKPSNIQ